MCARFRKEARGYQRGYGRGHEEAPHLEVRIRPVLGEGERPLLHVPPPPRPKPLHSRHERLDLSHGEEAPRAALLSCRVPLPEGQTVMG